MEHCPKCHAKVGTQYLFCEECGANLREQIIQKPKIEVIRKVETKEIENLKKQIEDSKKRIRGLKNTFDAKLEELKKVSKERVREVESKKEVRKKPKEKVNKRTKKEKVKKKETKISKKKPTKPKTRGKRIFSMKFKLPKLNFMKNIKKLKEPEFVKKR